MSLADLTTKIQRLAGATPDGIYGPETARKILSQWGVHEEAREAKFPSQAAVRTNKTVFGKPSSNLIRVDLPYKMRLAWDKATVISRISVNKACAESLVSILSHTLEHYGERKIRDLGLDLYGGCYNDRSIRGGTAKSMHAYGAALDLDPDRNALRSNHKTAQFARPEYLPFWEIVESHGWTSLGRDKDFDWMHIQAPGL